ncbi:MAG: butyrate kinase [Bacillota bacterium]|nr:butyrate kinase [Bacillota bacterium]
MIEQQSFLILAINPGANSTKLAVYQDNKPLHVAKIEHSDDKLAAFPKTEDQLPYRKSLIMEWLATEKIDLSKIAAIVARGGLLYPLEGGTYRINPLMVTHLGEAPNGSHASNLAGLIAAELAEEYGLPAFTVDPVAVDELEEVARLSGLKEIPRISKSHALNSKAVARTVAKNLGKKYQEMNMITVHLGSGITVAAHQEGRMIDVSNAVSGGPFAAERCGSLPVEELIHLCYSGEFTLAEMIRKVYRDGGLYSYLGVRDLRVVEEMVRDGNAEADIVLEAMAYQIAKEVGAMASVLAGEVECIILTGSMCYSQEFVARIFKRIEWIGAVVTVPGEEELEALAMGALRVLKGEEQAKEYNPKVAPGN